MAKRYRFIGDGAGVPGLPHELTEEDAHKLGVETLLMEALKNGAYEEVTPHTSLGAKPPKASKAPAQESE